MFSFTTFTIEKYFNTTLEPTIIIFEQKTKIRTEEDVPRSKIIIRKVNTETFTLILPTTLERSG